MANHLYDRLLRKLFRLRDGDTDYASAEKELWSEVKSDPDRYLEMFFHNWFNNNWTRPQSGARHGQFDNTMPPLTPNQSLPAEQPNGASTASKPSKPSKPYRPQHRETPEEARERRKHEANHMGMSLMNMYLPDGETRVKDATGKQMKIAGGWFLLIAKHVKATEIVGRKLTAEQVANLWGQAQK